METMEYSNEYIMQEALYKIANTISYLQEEAEKEGNKLDGMAAISLANDSNWLRSIAQKALTQVEERQQSEKEKKNRENEDWEKFREGAYKAWKNNNNNNQ